MRVDVRSRKAWLSEGEYEAVMQVSTKKKPANRNPLFAGAIHEPGTVLLHKAAPEQMPEVRDRIVETDVAGLLAFVDWLNGGEPFQNPLWPPAEEDAR